MMGIISVRSMPPACLSTIRHEPPRAIRLDTADVSPFREVMQTPEPRFHLQANFEFLLESVGRQRFPDGTRTDETSVRCLTGLPHPFGNLVILRQPDAAGYMELLKELETWTRQTGAPVSILLFPSPDRDRWVAEANNRKWTQILAMPGMWMALDDETAETPPEPGVETRLVTSPEDLNRVCEVVSHGYPVPENVADFFMRGIDECGRLDDTNLANFLLTVDGEPAACASVCVKDGVAGIYCVATLEAFRRRGLGGLATRAALNHGRRLGATHALLHASDQGESVYRRIGFTEHCRVSVLSFGM
jgi:GNAT superfamily N-acetyltransferase